MILLKEQVPSILPRHLGVKLLLERPHFISATELELRER